MDNKDGGDDSNHQSLLNINRSKTTNNTKKSTIDGESKNKRKIKIAAIVGVLLIAITVIIIMATKKSGGGDKPDPGPSPPTPPSPGVYNPYTISQLTNDGKQIKGYLSADNHVPWTLEERTAYKQSIQADVVNVLDPRVILEGENNQLISNVSFELGTTSQSSTYLWMDNAANPRFSPPEESLSRPNQAQSVGMRNDMNGMTVCTDNGFSFKFTDNRNSSNVLLDTEGGSLILMDKYIQLDMKLPSRRIYGLGERSRKFTLEEGTWTMWANGQKSQFDNGTGGLQTYGVHPFVLVQTAIPGEFFGIFFRNANAQSPVLKYTDNKMSTLSYITTGGTLELYFFWKGTAKQVIKSYQSTFGKPSMPPLWALGWHSSANAYKTLDMVKTNVENYKNASIPLEGIWLDIPYMQSYEDFSVNNVTFSGLKEFTEQIQGEGMRIIVIVDAGITADDDNNYYMDAQNNNVLIKSSINPDKFNGALTAKVWRNHTVFLDLWADEAKRIWAQGLKDLYDKVPYDGLWLDMNEATLFCNGECPENRPENQTKPEPSKQWYQTLGNQSLNSTYDLPFIPGRFWNLDNKTLSLNATHPEGKSSVSGKKLFNTHSLFGHMEAKATNEFLNGGESVLLGKRAFILSRSTFAGSGQYAQHWLGDNYRTWDDMRTSIAGIMNFNMFGIPLVGPDTCGYFGENVTVTQKLCTRWIQLATFYPFARQDRDDLGGGGENAPYAMSETFKIIAKAALHDRLQYSRHLYSCLYETTQDGGTCFDPLLFHFPFDDETFAIDKTEHSFIFANALKVTPVLDEKTSDGLTVSSYFPKGTWVNMNNFTDIIVSKGGQEGWKELPISWDASDKINTHLMPGAIVTKQEGTFFTTGELEDAPLTFIANRDGNGAANMKLYLDDGISNIQNTEQYQFVLSGNSLKKWDLDSSTESKRGKLLKLVITNAGDLNETNFACMTTFSDWQHVDLQYKYENMILTITKPSGDPIMLNELRDIHFGNDKKDTNMCKLEKQYHPINEAGIDLSGHKSSFIMSSDQISLPDLRVNLTLFKANASSDPIVNVQWSFAQINSTKKPFEVPTQIVKGPQVEASDLKLSDYVSISSSNTTPSITIKRGDQDIYTLNSMILDEYFNYIGAVAHTAPDASQRVGPVGIMGLFDRSGNELYLQDGVYSLWALSVGNTVETRTAPGQQMYGTNPFYLGKAVDNKWFGVYTNLAAAQDWWIKNDLDSGDVSVRTVAAGGLGDIFIMLADTPDAVSQTYHEIVGLPLLPPQWALGWNQCRWGYKDLNDLKYVVGNYSKYNIPLDTQWSDIDYLDRYRDFSYDLNDFNGLPDFIDDLHQKNMHWIPIIDAGIAQREGQDYQAYNEGVSQDIFVKSGDGLEILTAKVWPAEAVFPDFFNQDTSKWWQSWLSKMNDAISFDGLWLDMNEAANFCNGVCYESQQAASPIASKLPYIPTGRNLEQSSMPLDALHDGYVTEIDAHSLFGTMQAKATHDWFVKKDQRPMIIERSSFSGLGQYASRWLGDNYSNETFMGYSVTGLMAQNIIGVTLAGSDICGFVGDANPELCARWHTVGAFYSFSRNHNSWGMKPQEPYQKRFQLPYEGTTTYTDIMIRAINVKYSMIRYYYTYIHLIHINGGALYKPLFFEFPDDAKAYEDQPYNIMLGKGLKLGINSNALGQNETEFLFPKGTWCDLFKQFIPCVKNTKEESIKMQLPSKAYDFHLHLRDGYIVPMQDAASLNISTTADLQNHAVDFHILPKANASSWCAFLAAGEYVNDDGNSTKGSVKNGYNIQLYQYSWEDIDVFFQVNLYQQAEDFKDQGYKVNENDNLGILYIYDAQSLKMDQDYSVYISTVDGTDCGKNLPAAIYDKNSNRVTWKADKTLMDQNCTLLPNIMFITFTEQL